MPLASCKHFRDFMPHVRNISALYGVKTVFVTSDSPSVYTETAEVRRIGRKEERGKRERERRESGRGRELSLLSV